MKLVKQSKRDKKSGRCCAVTNSGKRCARKSIDGSDLCGQHQKMQQEIVKKLNEYKGHLLDEIPEPPADLDTNQAGRWRQVCEMLHEFGQLRGGYLFDIHHLIMLESLMEDIMKGINEGKLKDYLNEYVTESGHKGNNINGLWVLKRDTENEIASLKKTLWLTPEGLIKLVKGQQVIHKSTSQSPGMRKIKGWQD